MWCIIVLCSKIVWLSEKLLRVEYDEVTILYYIMIFCNFANCFIMNFCSVIKSIKKTKTKTQIRKISLFPCQWSLQRTKRPFRSVPEIFTKNITLWIFWHHAKNGSWQSTLKSEILHFFSIFMPPLWIFRKFSENF